MERKTISINPNLFNHHSKSKKSASKKVLPLKIPKPTNLKRELIKKIKTFQNKTRKNKKHSFDDRFNSEFRDSIEYLRNVMDEKNIDEPIPNNTLSTQKPATHIPMQQTTVTNNDLIPIQNSDIIKDDLPWGILKNGSKPTYRNWVRNNTLKQKKENDTSQINDYISKQNANEIEECKIEKREPRKIKKKITRKKYSCGKSKTKKQISIVIKGMESKNKVLREHRNLKQESIQNIKNYLYKKSFIKVGSTAPDKILRDMYESLVLTGDINNKNSHIMIHNYMTENI
jgi:hypothetical protein